MSRIRDIDLPRLYPDVRQHEHGMPAHAVCEPNCNPNDHHLCPAPKDWWLTRKRVMVLVACHTEGCAAQDVPVAVECDQNADGILRVLCGQCQEWLEDLTVLDERDLRADEKV